MAKRKYHLNEKAKTAIENGANVPIEWPDDGIDAAMHPSVEEMFIRQAVKYLTFKQREIWAYWNYDRLTQDQIAEKLHMGQANVAHSIKAIERRIAKYCKENQAAYDLLKAEYGSKDQI